MERGRLATYITHSEVQNLLAILNIRERLPLLS
jgi:hypothetical protein